jgi:DNA (cytosine-5)-methyltransferase 1
MSAKKPIPRLRDQVAQKGTRVRTAAALELIFPEREEKPRSPYQGNSLTTIDLFCGAGGITEGFRQAGFKCLYAYDIMPEAIETFRTNHPGTRTECRDIELVSPAEIRASLRMEKGQLDVLVGGPPCQGFSINAPERFLNDPRNKLFKDYVRFLEAAPQ